MGTKLVDGMFDTKDAITLLINVLAAMIAMVEHDTQVHKESVCTGA